MHILTQYLKSWEKIRLKLSNCQFMVNVNNWSKYVRLKSRIIFTQWKINKKPKRVIFRETGLVFPTPTTGNVKKGSSKAQVLWWYNRCVVGKAEGGLAGQMSFVTGRRKAPSQEHINNMKSSLGSLQQTWASHVGSLSRVVSLRMISLHL